MITAYATLKKAAAIANHDSKRLDDQRYRLIVRACDEILEGQHHDMFPLHVWMTGSGTQLNMNVNEVISNRCCQLAGTPLGSHAPVHPNDDVNMAQSSNDFFPFRHVHRRRCQCERAPHPHSVPLPMRRKIIVHGRGLRCWRRHSKPKVEKK